MDGPYREKWNQRHRRVLLDASKGIEYCRIGFELLNELKPDGADCFHNQAPEEESLSLGRPGIKRSASLGGAAQLYAAAR